LGWNTAAVFIAEHDRPGYFQTFPVHSAKRATEMMEGVGQRRKQSRISTLDEGLSPPAGWFCIGAYEKGALLSGLDELYGIVENPNREIADALRRQFPGAVMLFVELASATNYFAYALHEDNDRRRALAGDAQRGLVVDEGGLQPEEKPHFERSFERNGSRVFHAEGGGEMREYPIVAYGETLVFAMTARFLGKPLDHFPAERLGIELVRKASANPLKRLFSR